MAPFGKVALALLCGASGASAQTLRTARLDYRLGPGAEVCPDERAVKDAVAGRLGYFPFQPEASVSVAAKVQRLPEGLAAHVELRDASGKVQGVRDLSSTGSDCVELASAMELAISIAIDPLSLTRQPLASKPEPPAPPQPSAPPMARDEAASSMRRQAEIGVVGALGAAPDVAVGAELSVGIGIGPRFSFDLELRGDLPSSRAAGTGEVSTALVVASFVPCAHAAWRSTEVGGCALASAGTVYAAGAQLVGARGVWDPYAGLGGRVRVELPLGERFAFAFHVDLVAPLDRTTLRVDGQPAWSTPPVMASAGLRLVGKLR